MDRSVLELLAKLHGVTFDEQTTDEALTKALEDAVQANGGSTPPAPVATPPAPTPAPTPPAPTPPAPTNVPPAVMRELEKQSEDNTYLAAVLAELKDQRKTVAELQIANRLQEVRRKLADVGNARRVLTPHVGQKLSELVAAMPPKAGDRVIDVIKEILDDDGTVELGERGRAVLDNNKDAGVRFESEVAKLQEADKNISYADATTAVAAQNPELFEAYRASAISEYR